MSNRRRSRTTPLADMFAALDGARIPGGCDTCDAYQVVAANYLGVTGVTNVEVHHDDWCPTYRRMHRQANR